jgi:NADH-quinone oxidoreductase subunit C
METADQTRTRLLARFPAATISVITNPSPSAQHSLLIDLAHAVEVATWLRDEPGLALDQCTNVTGIDWPDKEIVDTIKSTVADPAGGPAKIIEEKSTRVQPGYFEVVYHLYSVTLKQGPLVLRLRTRDHHTDLTVPSLTPVWRSCEFQEREVYDLYGVKFEGHPDLRRLLMWDEFVGHPMRRDYVEPDDYEWEPTPHGEVLDRARQHWPAKPAQPAVATEGSPP